MRRAGTERMRMEEKTEHMRMEGRQAVGGGNDRQNEEAACLKVVQLTHSGNPP